MNIAIITWEYPPYFSGGLGRHCYYLTSSLEKFGNRVTVFTQYGKSDGKKIKIINVGKIFSDCYYTKCKEGEHSYSCSNFLECFYHFNHRIFRLFSFLIKEGQHFDVVHCHDWLTFPAGIKIKEKYGIPLVITFHSLEYDRCAETIPWEVPLNTELEGIKNADIIIANSGYTKERLISKYNAPPEKIRVIYNGINAKEFKVAREDGRKIVLYLGRLTLHKGVDYFLEAAGKILNFMPNARFIVAGSGEQLPNLIEKAIELGIADKVIFTGWISDEEVKKLYALADVYVLPSISEPFGITILEALASGTPAIVSKNSGVREISNHILTVDFWDVDEMVNKVVGILKYPAIKKEIVRNAYRDLEKLSWDRVAGETIKVYMEAILCNGP